MASLIPAFASLSRLPTVEEYQSRKVALISGTICDP